MTELTIERLGHQGDGIAPGPVFVPGVLPGEVVSGDVHDGRMDNPRIVTPSSDRVKPPCRHAKSCGGCALQHASDIFVRDWKVQVVKTALAAQGIDAEIEAVHVSEPSSRRRAAFSGRRTKKGALVGFHARGSGTVVAIPDCQLLTPTLLATVPVLEQLVVCGGSRKGELTLTVTDSPLGADVLVAGGKPLDRALRSELAQIAGQGGIARLTWDDELVAQSVVPVQRFGDTDVPVPPGAFLQATETGQNALISAVLETVSGRKNIIDLFAGCGTFSLPAAKTAEVHAVEGLSEMMQALDAGWRQSSGLKSVTTETRDLFRRPLLPDELKSFDAAIIDPPRAGAEAQIVQLAKSAVPVIAMVSCNPVSFARDAKILVEAGFELSSLRVIDQFRWSTHVEISAAFTR